MSFATKSFFDDFKGAKNMASRFFIISVYCAVLGLNLFVEYFHNLQNLHNLIIIMFMLFIIFIT